MPNFQYPVVPDPSLATLVRLLYREPGDPYLTHENRPQGPVNQGLAMETELRNGMRPGEVMRPQRLEDINLPPSGTIDPRLLGLKKAGPR